MDDPFQDSPFLSALGGISKLLHDPGVRGVLIGGVAASLLGRPRFTNDIDLLILDLDGRILPFIEKLKSYGIEPRISDAEAFARRARVLLARHAASGINIDISMGILPFENEAIQRRIAASAAGIELYVPTPEDLIILKSIAQRPTDLQDIQAIVGRHPNLDKERILSAVKEFADLLGRQDIHAKIEQILR
jgi:predicted nucleotidyltransferase